MILHHIDQLEARIRNSTGISDQQKAELLTLLASMRAEAGALPGGAPAGNELPVDEDRSTEEVMGEINASVAGLEASHPRLTQLTNQIAVVLSNMGI